MPDVRLPALTIHILFIAKVLGLTSISWTSFFIATSIYIVFASFVEAWLDRKMGAKVKSLHVNGGSVVWVLDKAGHVHQYDFTVNRFVRRRVKPAKVSDQ